MFLTFFSMENTNTPDRERDTECRRGAAEPYAKLGEGAASSGYPTSGGRAVGAGQAVR
jgi:hypothetical protein